jgi:alpha,alpha-trehalase
VAEWFMTYEGWDPDREGLREALCTVGNGYVAVRGALPESCADGVHYPGTYVAGVYNRLGSEVAGRLVENESVVNVPNWLPVSVRAAGGGWFGREGTTVLDHRIELDVHRAVLTRHSRLRDADGRIVQLTQRRFASMRDRHLLALETTVVAENWSGLLEIRSALDATVRNNGVARYRSLPDRHLVPVEAGAVDDEVVHLVVTTTQSCVRIGEAARTRLFRDGRRLDADRPALVERPGYVAHDFAVEVGAGDEVVVEKVVALFTSRDQGVSEPGADAREWAADVAGSFEDLLRRHAVAWDHIWSRMRIAVGADGEVERLLHLHELHLLQTVSNNSVGSDVGVPARGLHGEAYRGHIFWDDLFVFPFLSLRFPQLTRALLLYRYHRLDRARRNARDAGRRGAMFPWQSASSGREETQTMHLNPNSGRWLPDASHLQHHVNAAIAVNVWQYYQATGDLEFLRFHGAELIVEIARFWASTATYSHALDRYEIKGVMGPDEYHDGYPGRAEPGLDNNAYTNLMAVWCLCRAFDVLDVLPPVSARELREHLDLGAAELAHWDDVSRKMRVCFHDGVISQFEGFGALDELDWERYRATYGDIARLDRILEAEGDTPNRYKLTKQADVLMLFYVLSTDELAELLARLGYPFDDGLVARNVDYYSARTANGSTLSRVVEAWVTARQNRARSWKLFVEAVRSDYDDCQHGTTAEGIHIGAMGGTIDLIQRCYTGLETRQDALRLDPVIPDELQSLAYDVRYRGQLVTIEVTPERLQVRVDLAEGGPITVEVYGRRHHLMPGRTLTVDVREAQVGTFDSDAGPRRIG